MKIDVPQPRLKRVPKKTERQRDRHTDCDCDCGTRHALLSPLSAVRAIFSHIISSALIKISALSSQTYKKKRKKKKNETNIKYSLIKIETKCRNNRYIDDKVFLFFCSLIRIFRAYKKIFLYFSAFFYKYKF